MKLFQGTVQIILEEFGIFFWTLFGCQMGAVGGALCMRVRGGERNRGADFPHVNLLPRVMKKN